MISAVKLTNEIPWFHGCQKHCQYNTLWTPPSVICAWLRTPHRRVVVNTAFPRRRTCGAGWRSPEACGWGSPSWPRQCAIREETGLTVSNLRMCGVVEWETIGERTAGSPAEASGELQVHRLHVPHQLLHCELNPPPRGMEWMTGRIYGGSPAYKGYIRVMIDERHAAYGISGRGMSIVGGMSRNNNDLRYLDCVHWWTRTSALSSWLKASALSWEHL